MTRPTRVLSSAEADFREKLYGLLVERDKIGERLKVAEAPSHKSRLVDEINAVHGKIVVLSEQRPALTYNTECDYLDDKNLNARLGVK